MLGLQERRYGPTRVRLASLVCSERSALAIILLAGFLLRLWLSVRAPLDLDEGQFLYDARLLWDGRIPFVDYTTRAPLLLICMALSFSIFGYGFVAGRLVIIVLTVGTAFLLYRLGRELGSGRAGLIAAAFYSLLPFSVYGTFIVKEEPAQAFVVTLGVYLILLAVRTDRGYYFFLAGIVLGSAYLVRRSSFAYLAAAPILLWLSYLSVPKAVRGFIILLAGALLALSPLLIIVASVDWKWLYLVYGPGGLSLFIQPDELDTAQAGYDTGTVVLNAAMLTVPILSLSLAYVLRLVIVRAKGKMMFGRLLPGLVILGLSIVLLSNWTREFVDGYGMIPLGEGDRAPAFLCALLGLVLAYLLASASTPIRADRGAVVAMWWVGSIGGAYLLLKSVLFVNYFVEVLPPLSLMSAFALAQWLAGKGVSWRQAMRSPAAATALLLVSFLLFHTVFTAHLLADARTYARSWPVADVLDVGRYVADRTANNEQVLTMGTIFAVQADRPVVLNISHQALYQGVQEMPLPYDPAGVVPRISEILGYLAANNVRYAIVDQRTYGILNSHPTLRQFFYANYVLEASFPVAKVYRRSGDTAALAVWNARHDIRQLYLGNGFSDPVAAVKDWASYSSEVDPYKGDLVAFAVFQGYLMPPSFSEPGAPR